MKNYLKIFVCFALVAMMLLGAVACGGNTITTEEPTDNKTEAPTTEKPTEEVTEEPTTEDVSDKETTEAPETKETETQETETNEPATTETETQETETQETETKETETTEIETEEPVLELRFDENGSFEVAIISDLRLNKNVDAEIIATMIKLIDEINPSLVLFGGDIHDGSVTNEGELRAVLDVVNAPLEERGILWCHTFGVDSEGKGGSSTGFSRAAQFEIYKTYKNCITPATAEGIYGNSNYVLPIKLANEDKIGFNLWCLDTNGYLNDYEEGMEDDVLLNRLMSGKTNFDTIHFSQMLWYWNKSVEFEEANGGEKVPGMMYFQIPAYQLYYLRKNSAATGMTGSMENAPSASERDSGIIWTCFERGDVKGIFCGYDAKNDYAGKYLDMIMAGCSSIGATAKDTTAGIRVVTITENGKKLATEMAYVYPRDEGGNAVANPEKPDVFKLEIDTAAGKVSNGGTSGYEYNDNNEGTPKKIVNDTELNMGSVVFDPSGSKLSSYTVHTSDFNWKFQDGFAYELILKVDVNPSQYVGVLDFEEAGGFGLNVYPSSKANTAMIYAEVATGASGWISLKHTINLHQWVHVVFSYNGTDLMLWVNGELVASEKANDAMRLPKFTGGTEEYFCIGGCAQSGHDTGFRGFTGALAACNVYSDPLTEELAKEMYKKVTLPEYAENVEPEKPKMDPLNPDLLKLEITANGASNKAENGTDLVQYGGEGTFNIAKDSYLDKNVLTFDGSSSGENYILSTDKFEQSFLDGFAYEAYFKATSQARNTSYMSVMDYCEAGGFGLNVYNVGDPNKLLIKAEIKIGSSYVSPEATINVGEWVHCVFSYDGTNIDLYVNGVLASSIKATSSLALPNFASAPKIIAIGSGASKNQISGDRFIGSIAVCNLFSDPITAEDAAAMYEANAKK